PLAELPNRNFAQDSQPLAGMVVEQAALLEATVAVGRRFLHQDADSVNVVVAVEPDVAALVVPVERRAVAVAGERVEPLPRIVAAGKGGCDLALGHAAVGIALALVQAGRTDEAEGCALGQVRGE